MAAAYNNISLGLFLINQVAILLFSRNGKKRQKRENFIAIARKEGRGKMVLGGDFSVPFRGHFGGIKTAVCIAIFIPSQIGPIFFI